MFWLSTAPCGLCHWHIYVSVRDAAHSLFLYKFFQWTFETIMEAGRVLIPEYLENSRQRSQVLQGSCIFFNS